MSFWWGDWGWKRAIVGEMGVIPKYEQHASKRKKIEAFLKRLRGD